jgi:hypothetical protein
MPRHNKVKINRANGQTGGKNCSSTFVLTAFISFGLFNVFSFPLMEGNVFPKAFDGYHYASPDGRVKLTRR